MSKHESTFFYQTSQTQKNHPDRFTSTGAKPVNRKTLNFIEKVVAYLFLFDTISLCIHAE